MWWTAQVTIDGEEITLPRQFAGLQLVSYGGVMLQLKADPDYVLSFTPRSNEFTITVSNSATMGHTAGLCGNTFMYNIPDHLDLSACVTMTPASALSLHHSRRCLRRG